MHGVGISVVGYQPVASRIIHALRTPIRLSKTGTGVDTTPNFEGTLKNYDVQQSKIRFRIKTKVGVLVDTVDSIFKTDNGVAVAEYATDLASGEYTFAAQTINGFGVESLFSSETAFVVALGSPSKSLVLLWDVEQLPVVTKELIILWTNELFWVNVEVDTPLTIWDEVVI